MMLEKITSPSDIKKLSHEEKLKLAEDIRARLIEVVLKNGGHLASNLGVTELTVGLYSVVDPFKDKVIWDVGHQAYVHKLLTGRNEQFDTLRQFGGISGFPKRGESDADCFETGHSSTSVSAAVGMARARDIQGDKYKVVAVIGDGAFTNGMVYEALNDAGTMKGSVVFILNDNGMSIARNVGGMSKYLGKIRSGKSYIKAKKNIKSGLGKIPLIGRPIVKGIQRVKTAFRTLTIAGEWFEELGIKYIGPIDGHNIETVEKALNQAFYLDCPVLIHAITHKGHGYTKAEDDPSAFHGVAPKEKSIIKNPAYSSHMAEELCKMAEKDEKIVAITAAMPSGTGLGKFAEIYPTRFFDVGIAEEHAITMAAGMAAAGLRPYVAIYSTFMQRAYDQLLHDCALQKLPVVITLDRAGISGRDGSTHHGVYDLAYLNSVPDISVCAPCCMSELSQMLKISRENNAGPFVIRYPAKDNFDSDLYKIENHPVVYGKGALLYNTLQDKNKKNVLIISLGQITSNCIDAAAALTEMCNASVYHARFLKPLDKNGIMNCIKEINPDVIVTAEDGVGNGGFGSSVATLLQKESMNCKFDIISVPEKPVEQGSIEELYEAVGLDSIGIMKAVLKLL